MKPLSLALLLNGLLTFCVFLSAQPLSDVEIDKKVDALLSRMTLEEKIGQMTQFAGINEKYEGLIKAGKIGSLLNVTGAANANAAQKIAVEDSRLGIPLILGFDVIHGYRTIFPIPLAEASSWDPGLAERTSKVAALEASAAGVEWTFAPMVDIARDPRWGRIAEGSGEDPYLGSLIAAARVRGFQGNDLSDPSTVVACVKHYVGYGAAEAGRDYNTVDMSRRTLRSIYLPPFHAAVEAGVGTLMSAFNDLNGVPASANWFTLTEVLRNEWGFKGFVVSDWNSVLELIAHGFAADRAEAAKLAVYAGVDMDMEGNVYLQQLPDLVKSGQVPEPEVDKAVREILRIKYKAGLFDHPYVDPQREKQDILSPSNLEVALEAARKSIVLLKNQNDLLPLSKNIRSLALVGPLADDSHAPLGPWAGQGNAGDVVTVMAGLKKKVPNLTLNYAKGCEVIGGTNSGFAEAVQAVKSSDAAVVVLGEAADMSGEAASRSVLDIPGLQPDLLKALAETGKPLVLVLMNGRPLTIDWAAENIPAIVETWFLGVRAGDAIADVLFGDYNPGAKLPVTFPRSVGQIPIYYNHLSTGRPAFGNERFTSRYLDVANTPLFPFGYGLSYTRFEYSNLQLSSPTIGMKDTLKVTAQVRNTGQRAGDEVVQLYIQDIYASVSQPVRELKRFQRLTLAPGETKTVEFELSSEDLRFWNQEMKFAAEPGKFNLWVGGNSTDGLEASFMLQ